MLWWIRRIDDNRIFRLVIRYEVGVIVARSLPFITSANYQLPALAILYLHIGMDSICILRAGFGFGWRGSAMRYQERVAMPTATIVDTIGRLSVCFAAVRKLMRLMVEFVYGAVVR